MRKIIPLIALITSMNAYASVIITKFIPGTASLSHYTVEGLDNINDVSTSGSYAWIVDSTKSTIAFYNGSVWTKGATIAGMSSIRMTYPISEDNQSPLAWALGDGLAFFNGQSWTTYENVSIKAITIAKGNLWIQPDNTDNQHTYFLHANYKNPMQLNKIDYHALHPHASMLAFTSAGTVEPVLFVAYGENSKNNLIEKMSIYKYTPDGKEELVTSATKSFPANTDFFFTTDGDQIALIADDSIWYSPNNGLSWSTHATLPDYAYYVAELTDGKLCLSNSAAIVCQFLTNNNTRIYDYSDLIKTDNVTIGSRYVTQSYMALAFYRPRNPTLFEFDFQTTHRTDLRPERIAKYFSHVSGLPNHRYIACGSDKLNNQLSVFYFNENAWSSLTLNQNKKGCDVNLGQSTSNTDTVTDYAWITYNDYVYMPNPDNNFMRKKSGARTAHRAAKNHSDVI